MEKEAGLKSSNTSFSESEKNNKSNIKSVKSTVKSSNVSGLNYLLCFFEKKYFFCSKPYFFQYIFWLKRLVVHNFLFIYKQYSLELFKCY